MSYELEFNARSLPAGDVARSFVPPERHFRELLSRSHTLVVGPRGSGKTTLLKMLTIRAWRQWHHEKAAEYAQHVAFNAAFIPADVTWGKQLEALDPLGLHPERREGAFSVHTLRSLIQAMRDAVDLGRRDVPPHLAHFAAALSPALEEQFVRLAADQLGVRPGLPSLLGLELALEGILDRIGSGSTEIPVSMETLPAKISFLIHAFNGLIGDDDRRWALLFDELEIAPTRIKSFLLSSVRSFDERVVIKLAIAPYMEDVGFDATPTSPQALHDYHTVQLTYPNKEDAAQFTDELFNSTFHRLGIDPPSMADLFVDARAISSTLGKRMPTRRRAIPDTFFSLAAKDESFAAYVKDRGILSGKYNPPESQFAQEVRKVQPIVTARDYYLRRFEKGRVVQERSRKAHLLYTGYPAIAEITEGNPRAILTLVTPLAQGERAIALAAGRVRPIGPAAQARSISRVELLLTSLLQVIPLDLGGFETDKGLLGFVDKIGRALQDRLLRRPFHTDYVGTFVLDSNVSPSVVSAVGKALNAGAIIHVPYEESGSDALLRGLKGQRFRISYALAARYRLLLTLGDRISLSKLLLEWKGLNLGPDQSSLFEADWNE